MNPAPARPMGPNHGQPSRLARRVAIGITLAALGLAGTYQFLLPLYLEARIRHAFAKRGDARFESIHVTGNRARLRNVVFDRGRVRVSQLDAHYGLSTLGRGRAASIELAGVAWSPGKQPEERPSAPTPSETQRHWIEWMPTDHIVVRDFRILTGRHETPRASVTGTLTRTAPLEMTAAFAGKTLSREVQIDASLTASGAATEFSGELVAGRDRIGAHGCVKPTRAGAQTCLEASGGLTRIETGHALAGSDLAFDVRTCVVGGRVVSLSASASAREVAAAGHSVRNVRATARTGVDRISYEVIAKPTELSHLGVRGGLPSALTSWPGREPFSIEIEHAGAIPPVVRAWLATRGIVPSDDLAVHLTSRGKLRRTELGWAANIAIAHLRGEAQRLALGDTQLRQVALDAVFSGGAWETGAELVALPGSTLQATLDRDPDGETKVRVRAAALSAMLVVPAAITLSSRAPRWAVDAPGAVVGARVGRVTHARLSAYDVRARQQLWLAAEPRHIRCGLLHPGSMRARAVAIVPGVAKSRVRLAALDLTISNTPSQPMYESSGDTSRLTLAVDLAKPARATGLVSGRVLRLRTRVAATVDREGVESLRAPTAIAFERIHAAGTKLTASGSANVPIAWFRNRRRTDRASGWLRLTQIRWRNAPLPALTGRLTHNSDQWGLTATASVSTAQAFAVKARAGFAPRPWLAAEVWSEPFAVRPGDALHDLVTARTGLDVTGTLGVDIHVRAGGDRPRARARLSLSNVLVKTRDGQSQLDGLRGQLDLAWPPPVSSGAAQQLIWTKAKLASHPLGRGSIRFRMRRRSMDVERIAFRTGKGLIYTSPFSIEPRKRESSFRLQLSGIDLATWLPIISKRKLAGTGRLDGTIAVSVRYRPTWGVTLHTGTLRTRGPGTLRATDVGFVEQLLTDFTPQAADGSSLGARVRERILGALVDFAYSDLFVRVAETPGQPDVQIRARGKGRRVPQDVDLRINLTGVKTIVHTLLRKAMTDL